MDIFLQLFLFAFGTIGMTHIIVDSSLFAPVRDWLKRVMPEYISKVFNCYQCCGTWCGFLAGAITLTYNPFLLLLCGCAGSFLSYLAAIYLTYLEAQSVVNIPDKGGDK